MYEGVPFRSSHALLAQLHDDPAQRECNVIETQLPIQEVAFYSQAATSGPSSTLTNLQTVDL
jgi:hypothetical protein